MTIKKVTTNVINLSKEVAKLSKQMVSDMKIVRHKFNNTSVNGFIDDVPVGDVVRFEAELHDFIGAKYPNILEDLKAKKKIDDDIKGVLETALNEFKTVFNAK